MVAKSGRRGRGRKGEKRERMAREGDRSSLSLLGPILQVTAEEWDRREEKESTRARAQPLPMTSDKGNLTLGQVGF